MTKNNYDFIIHQVHSLTGYSAFLIQSHMTSLNYPPHRILQIHRILFTDKLSQYRAGRAAALPQNA